MENSWNLSPAYDLTYSLNPLLNYKRVRRALSINAKRIDITSNDILKIAESYTVKNAKNTILEIQEAKYKWKENANKLRLPLAIIESVFKDFKTLI
jgi:serine/threonine-protein kinase HipA